MTSNKTGFSTVRVEAVMTRSLLTVDSDESVLMAFELLSRAGVHHLPVMNADGTCLGIVSLETLAAWTSGPLRRSRPPVRDLADRRLLQVGLEDLLQQVALIMDANEADALLVFDGDHLVGLLTWRDLVRYVAGVTRPDHASTRTRSVLFSLDPVIELADRD